MILNATPIELDVRLRTLNRALDTVVHESSGTRLEETVDLVLDAVSNHDQPKAVAVLRRILRDTPCWLRGYLLLATIYEAEQDPFRAIATIEQGLEICALGLRVSGGRRLLDTVGQRSGSLVHDRMRRNIERLTRYRQMFLHRMLALQLQCGRLDEAIEGWPARDDTRGA